MVSSMINGLLMNISNNLNFISKILFCVIGVILGITVISYRKMKVKIKVLTEAKEELEEEVQEKKQTITAMEKAIPVELYHEVIQTKENQVQLVPSYHPFAVMEMNMINFNDKIHAMQANDIFEFINHILMNTVPYVYGKNGIVEKFTRSGFTAFFDKSCEEALTAAVSIMEVILEDSPNWAMYDQFAIGLSYGTVLSGLAGTDRRMSLITVSEYTAISNFLQSIAVKYDAKILATGAFCRKIQNFEQKFNVRKLGYLYITATKSLEEIYDIYDGDLLEVRNNKRKTKIIFEKAVTFYAKGDYEKARQYFIEVFKTNRYDLAANEYLKCCDANIAKQQSGELDKDTFQPQIETF